jgi:hypothetical protein
VTYLEYLGQIIPFLDFDGQINFWHCASEPLEMVGDDTADHQVFARVHCGEQVLPWKALIDGNVEQST